MNTSSVRSNDSSISGNASDGKVNNSSYKVHEKLAEAKIVAKLVKSKLLKKGSKDAIKAIDNLFTIISGLTSKLTFVKGKTDGL